MADRIPGPLSEERIAVIRGEMDRAVSVEEIEAILRRALHEAAAAEADKCEHESVMGCRDRARAHRAAAEEPTR